MKEIRTFKRELYLADHTHLGVNVIDDGFTKRLDGHGVWFANKKDEIGYTCGRLPILRKWTIAKEEPACTQD